ncbi:MAG: hypothetical protein FWG99_05105 [Treponema sp.]|nr:hypothetical protein [Treponema sp.]
MKKQIVFMIGTLMFISLALTGCPSGGGGGGEGPITDNFPHVNETGTWKTNVTKRVDGGTYNTDVYFTINSAGKTWNMIVMIDNYYNDSGTYVRDRDRATLTSHFGGDVGTATITGEDTIRITLNKTTEFPGTYTITRQ